MSVNKLFSDSDWALTAKLPDWATDFLHTYPVPCYQAAEWYDAIAPLVTDPATIEIYLNGAEHPALVWINGSVVFGDFQRLCEPYHAITFEIDAMVRYVEIEGKTLLDTTSGIVWPDIICSPAAQVEMLLNLARQI